MCAPHHPQKWKAVGNPYKWGVKNVPVRSNLSCGHRSVDTAQLSSAGVPLRPLLPQGTYTISGGIFGCHNWRRWVPLASDDQSLGCHPMSQGTQDSPQPRRLTRPKMSTVMRLRRPRKRAHSSTSENPKLKTSKGLNTLALSPHHWRTKCGREWTEANLHEVTPS